MPTMTARRDSPCTVCRLTILQGERMFFTRSTGAQHLLCTESLQDPEVEILEAYASYLAVGDTDEEAFENCVKIFRYVPTVRALLQVSSKARDRDAAYRRTPRSSFPT